MAKAIPRVGSRRNGRIGSRKSARRIPKGVIHVQASFNNTIVTVTDVRGRVVSWSSAGTCGFRGTRRGTPFAAQTAAGNAIRAVVDQGMQRAEVMIKGPGLGRDAALRAIRRSGILLTFVPSATPMPSQIFFTRQIHLSASKGLELPWKLGGRCLKNSRRAIILRSPFPLPGT
ncbi:unnamed protein product [Ilex paraguariensis]|uniref:30S ribosomal protein S11, chloroplastic n=1 Tax=Ilex paraguariensis TaxID=185542 RepID=A0ABC8QND6_9AQUA